MRVQATTDTQYRLETTRQSSIVMMMSGKSHRALRWLVLICVWLTRSKVVGTLICFSCLTCKDELPGGVDGNLKW